MPENNPQVRNPGPQIKIQQVGVEVSVGPIPPPQILQQYNQVVPDAAERIIRMAEKQSDHRIDLERKVVDSNIRKSYIGMVLATIIALYGLYIAKEISINGNPWAAGIIAALDLGGLISVAVYNGLIQKKEREKRRETSSTVPMLH
jgi:uncharacterized membrane protein